MATATQDRIRQWQANTPTAFLQWLADIKPRILVNSRYEIFTPTDRQLKLIHEILKPAENKIINSVDEPVKPIGARSHSARKARPSRKPESVDDEQRQARRSSFQHSLSLIIEPRRHGKSTIFSLIILWIFTSRKNCTVQLLGNTESHCRRVQFQTVKKIITNTPTLRKLIPEKQMFVFEIFFPALGNVIQMSPGNNPSTSFGEKIDVLWVSDLHAATDLAPFNALQGSLLDSKDSLLLIDSNVDSKGGTVHMIQQESKNDPSIFCHHKFYRNLDEYCAEAPPWISRTKARRLAKTSLPADFRRDILGKRSDAKNSLFPSDVIDLCKSPYKIPVDDIKTLTQGRAYKIGGGLDRSKSLLGSALGGDNTIWTTILKVAGVKDMEPEIFILNQQNILPNTSASIKKAILKDHQRYHLNNVILEDYEVVDLLPWIEAQGITVERMSPHSTRQNASFPELARIAREGRLHFPQDEKKLASEMATFSYSKAKRGENYSFGHSSKNQKDDRVYSLNWAIYALRSQIMNLYTINRIQCTSKSRNRRLCYLMGGDLELFCSENCEAAIEIRDMHRQFLQYQLDSEIQLSDFYRTHVKLIGLKIYQAV
ncbi:MAG: hypothetical protein HN416_09705 [Nitrospina sp.]|jgi:hypothetical protein|nr:hypothetical protein [Nitrospina sp.]